LREISN